MQQALLQDQHRDKASDEEAQKVRGRREAPQEENQEWGLQDGGEL